MLDILICILPKINPDAPTVGPAVLKSHLMHHGFTCDVVDFNVKLFNELKSKNKQSYFEDDVVFTKTPINIDWYAFRLSSEFNSFYEEFEYVFLDWIQYIKEKNPKYLGLSLLSGLSQNVAIKICQLMRVHLPHIKIVWGGAGIDYKIDIYKKNNLLDHYVWGDGENSIVELLKGNLSASGIDSRNPNQVLDLDGVLMPNYDDIDWSEYDDKIYEKTGGIVYVTGSRGCVKRCNFCDVYKVWPEYRFRSGKSIAKEIITIKQKYNRTTFKFTDSLINGSMKAFNELLTELIKYRKTDDSFYWHSQWIIRSKSPNPEKDIEHYRLIKESGCDFLEVGLESFSQHIRFHMGKKFTDEDMWWCIELLNKYQIPHVLLMIVGYATETEEDHQHAINCVKKVHEMGWNKYTRFSFTNTLMISSASDLYATLKDDFEYYEDQNIWKYKDNDYPTRLRRFNEINTLVNELGYIKKMEWLTEKTWKKHNDYIKTMFSERKTG